MFQKINIKKEIVILILIGLIFFLIFFPYGNVEFHDTWDDHLIITNNTLLNSLNIFKHLSDLSLGSYFPLTTFSFSVENYLWGLDVQNFLILNLIMHLINAYLVFCLLQLLFKKTNLQNTNSIFTYSLMGGLLFLVQPLSGEVIFWANQRRELYCFAFYLGSIIFYLKHRDSFNKNDYLILFILVLSTYLSKAMGFTLPVILFFLEMFFGNKSNRRSKIYFFIFLFFIAFIILFFELSAQARPLKTQLIDISHSLIEPYIFYISRAIYPIGLRVYYTRLFFSFNWIDYLFSAAFIGFLFFTLKNIKNPVIFFILYLVITLIPTLKIIPFGIDSFVNNRYWYLPSVGFVALIVSFLGWNDKILKKHTKILSVVFIFYLSYLGNILYKQKIIWENSKNLWENQLIYEPLNIKANAQLGLYLTTQDHNYEAAFFLKRAIKLGAKDLNTFSNYLVVLYKNKNYTECVIVIEYIQSHFNLEKEFELLRLTRKIDQIIKSNNKKCPARP
jgi:hypothetical protein